MAVTIIIQGVVLGILTGGIYALMASGLTLIFGVLEIINVAQGILVVLGAYLSFVLERSLHIDLFLGLLITLPVMFGLGVLLEWALIRRLKWERITLSILATYAIALIIEGVLGFIFTTNFQELHAWYIDATFNVNGFYINYVYIFAFLLSVVLLAGLFLLIYRTAFGRKLRASMQNRTAASLIGINVSRVMVIIGDVVALIWSPVWSSTVFFVLLALLLVFRPRGLFGRLEGRKQ